MIRRKVPENQNNSMMDNNKDWLFRNVTFARLSRAVLFCDAHSFDFSYLVVFQLT
jgi:hypothetical protein